MAGYRLAPRAARARRRPHQRRRGFLPSRGVTQTLAVGTAAETDTSVALLYVPRNVAVGTATEADSAVAVTATGQNPGQAGLVWFWQVAAPSATVTVGTAFEADTAVAIAPTGSQAVLVGVASEQDRGVAVLTSPDSVVVTVEQRHRARRYFTRGGEW